MPVHLDILAREFQNRIRKNSRYSLRAYAKFLGLHSSALSRIFAGKLPLTAENGVRISQKLKLETDESRRFIRSVLEDRELKTVKKVGDMIRSPKLRPNPKKISNELYAQIATLRAMSILQLTFIKDFDSDYEAIAECLKMSVPDVVVTVETLIQAGLLIRESDGGLKNAEIHLTAVESTNTSKVRKSLQEEILRMSLESLHQDDFGKRLHYGMTMAIDPTKLEYAREKFMSFMETLSDELESENRSQVYQMSLSLFPVSYRVRK